MVFVAMAANVLYIGEGRFTLPKFATKPESSKYYQYTATERNFPYIAHHASEMSTSALGETRSFGGLLEAATTSAGATTETVAFDTGHRMDTGNKKRKRSSPSPEPDAESAPKRARMHSSSLLGDSQSLAPMGANGPIPTYPAPNSIHQYVETPQSNLPGAPYIEAPDNHPSCPTTKPRLHSAAALFRRASDKSTRKYTRLSMSKIFMSLQLSPESFLHLQAQAKTYMLDAAHAERQSCVGNRGKCDTDMAKLRLFNCVRDFLNDGAGEQFFGEKALHTRQNEKDVREAAKALGEEDEMQTEGNLMWPRDGNEIIGLVTPLLRRMVTNERQRVYASEMRKGGARSKEDSVGAAEEDLTASRKQDQDSAPFAMPCPSQEEHHGVLSVAPAHRSLYHLCPPLHTPMPSTSNPRPPLSLSHPGFQPRAILVPPAHLVTPEPHIAHVNIFFKKHKRILASVRLHDASDAPLFRLCWSALLSHIHVPIVEAARVCGKSSLETLYRVEAMGSMGRAVVETEDDWENLKVDIAWADWADRTVNVVAALLY